MSSRRTSGTTWTEPGRRDGGAGLYRDPARFARCNRTGRQHLSKPILLSAVLAATAHASASPSSERSTQMPPAIRAYLESHGLRAVQGSPGCNVFSGHLYRPDQTDWAVSCLDDSSIHIFVFRAGGTAHVDEVVREQFDDVHGWLFLTKNPCTLTRASPKVVRYFHEAWSKNPEVGDEAPSIRPVRHDGIEQWVAECCSVIHYWHGGRWWKITGMD